MKPQFDRSSIDPSPHTHPAADPAADLQADQQTHQPGDPQAPPIAGSTTIPPRLSVLLMFRLGLFQLGLGIMSVLTLGVINRIAIDELKIPALITAGAIAMHQFVAPARVWFGQLSDAKPLWGMHRTGYVWLGSILFTLTSFIALQVLWQLGNSLEAAQWSQVTSLWAIALALVFGIYGLALSSSSTPFTALLVDVSDEDNRSQLVSVTWSMLMVGIIIGGITSGKILSALELNSSIEQLQAAVNRLFTIMPCLVLGLTFIATFGVEQKYSRFAQRTRQAQAIERDDSITLKQAFKVLTTSRQTGFFFTFLFLMTLSLFMQDAVLEPYGGEVFGMEIGETSKLNTFFGTGTLLGIAITGFLIIPRLGKQRTVRLAGSAVALSLVGFVFAGTTGQPEALQFALLIFGLMSGILTAGAIGLMLDLTAAETAGTFVGAWGLAQAVSRGISTLLGGALLDLGKLIFNQPLLAYGLVFFAQACLMTIALILLRRVNVKEFQANARQALTMVMEGDLD